MEASELKKKLTVEDVIELVTKGLGSDGYFFDADGNPIFQTVCHNEPGCGKYKLYYYIESQMFHCYTQCGDSFDIFELIERAGKADSFTSAMYYVIDFFGIEQGLSDIEKTEVELTSDWDLLNKYEDFKKEGAKPKELIPIQENILEYFSPVVPTVWREEGIDISVMKKYGIRMDIPMQKIIIPHYDIEGNLIGIRGRSYNEIELEEGKKYAPVYIQNTMYNHPLGENLYGLNHNKDTIKKVKKAVIFEGEKSVLKAETFYGENNFTVAACGSSVSDTQVKLLLELGVNEIIIAFDKENDDILTSDMTNRYREKLYRIASKFSPYVNTYYVFDTYQKLGYKDSPIDCGQETLEFLLKHKILVPSFSSIISNKRGNI